MFFYLSKLIWKIFTPVTFASLLILVGFFFRAKRAGDLSLKLGLAILVLIGFFPIGNNLVVVLEDMTEKPVTLPEKVNGIIILGGAIDTEDSVARGEMSLNLNAPRLTEMFVLAKRYPTAKILHTGGDNAIFPTSSGESDILSNYLKTLNYDTSRFIFENKSRNTYENLIFSQNLVHPKPDETWLLVTSAYHMPRSLAIFRTGGWSVIPYPVGYLTTGEYGLMPNLNVLGNMSQFHIAAHEIVGIIAYTLTGKITIDALHNDQETISPLRNAPVSDASSSERR